MAIKSKHYLLTFHPIKLHIFFQNRIKQILHKLGYTHHCYSHISEADHFHEQTLNTTEKALSVSDIFFGIH